MDGSQFQQLKQYVGAALLNYALNRTDIVYQSSFESLTINDKQICVLEHIHQTIQECRLTHIFRGGYGDGVGYMLGELFHNGESIFNYYRMSCDGVAESPTSDDPVIMHIQTLCIRNYPNMLIKSVGNHRFPVIINTNVGINNDSTFVTLIKNDLLNKITNDRDGLDYRFEFTMADGIQICMQVCTACATLITRAFYDACNRMDYSLHSVLKTIEKYVGVLRELAAGNTVQYSGFVGIRGVLFAGFSEIAFDGAALREYGGTNNPGLHTDRTVRSHPGEHCKYSGHVLEVLHSTRIQSLSSHTNVTNSEKVNVFQLDVVDKMLYSMIFSCECTRGPTASFSEIAFPLINPGNYSSSDQRQNHYLLIDELAKDNVKIWFNILRSKPLDSVKIPLHRLSYAIFRRKNAEDAILDAVIAWEGMFSGASETAFKVTASLAKYLSGPEERIEFLSRLQKLYRLRSALVHGTANSLLQQESVSDLRREVVGIGLRCLKKLLSDEELFPMSPQERVKYLLVLAEPTQHGLVPEQS